MTLWIFFYNLNVVLKYENEVCIDSEATEEKRQCTISVRNITSMERFLMMAKKEFGIEFNLLIYFKLTFLLPFASYINQS